MSTTYASFSELSELQTDIMKFVVVWVHEKKTPVPRKEIVKNLESKGVAMPNTRFAVQSLIRKGYIREAVMISNKTAYVLLRSL